MESFRPADWFYQLFGVKEDPGSFKSDEKNIINCKKVGDNYVLTSKINSLSYNAGNFQVRYIPSFLNNPKKRPVRNGGTLNIIIGNGRATNKNDFTKIDAFSMQSLPENDGATYLAASNFNCLEFVSCNQTAYSGVTNYVYDMTQGPYTALACPQSAVLRNYFIEFEDEKGNKRIGQLDSQINLLSKTPLRVENGYAIVQQKEMAQLKKSVFNWFDENKFAVGVHSNCDVLLKRSGKNNGDFVNLSRSHIQPTQKVSFAQSQEKSYEENQKESKKVISRTQSQTPAKEKSYEENQKESKKVISRTQCQTPAKEKSYEENQKESKKVISRTQCQNPAKVTTKVEFPNDDYEHKEDKKSKKKTIAKCDTNKKHAGTATFDIKDKNNAKPNLNGQDEVEKTDEFCDKKKAKSVPKQTIMKRQNKLPPPATKPYDDKHKSDHHNSDDDDYSSNNNCHEKIESSKKMHKLPDKQPPHVNLSNTIKGFDSNIKDKRKDNSDVTENSIPRLNIANHVYAASFNFNGNVIENDFTLTIASTMLKAEYKATVLAAWENSVRMEKECRAGARKLYLTLLGGGVFGNPLEIIAEAIKSCKDIIVKSGLDVYVVCFDRYSYGGIKKELDPLVKETKGKLIFYS